MVVENSPGRPGHEPDEPGGELPYQATSTATLNVPEVIQTTMVVVRTRSVEIPGLEVSQVSETHWETPRATGNAGAMEMASRWMGYEAEMTVQRAHRATTQNESKRTR